MLGEGIVKSSKKKKKRQVNKKAFSVDDFSRTALALTQPFVSSECSGRLERELTSRALGVRRHIIQVFYPQNNNYPHL